ncbi:MAG: shikimate kinase [Candidatus Methanomethylophilaceae archaeon]
MIGNGRSFGAITVVNAMACGIGCTIGIDLHTKAMFDPRGDLRKVSIAIDPTEDDLMAKLCVKRTYEHLDLEEPEGWSLTVDSNIPISRGLKSSSSACNAIIEAVMNSTGKEIDQITLIKLGVGCAKEAGVTVTGSFDDACGCHFGGIVMTDNRNNTLLFNDDIDDMDVIVYVPGVKIRKKGLQLDMIRNTAREVEGIVELAKTDPLRALTLNGRVFSAATGTDNSIAERAIENGALAAGLTGSGPAVAILVEKGKGRDFATSMELGDAIMAHTRRRIE